MDKEDEVSGIPTPGEVQDMVEKCLLWYGRQEESISTSLLWLKQIAIWLLLNDVLI